MTMKKSKLSVLVFAALMIAATSLSAATPETCVAYHRPLTVKDISLNNEYYAQYLTCYRQCHAEGIMMNVIKQKMLFPDGDYDCLVKPLKKIIRNCKDSELSEKAKLTLRVLMMDDPLSFDENLVSNQNTAEFFQYIRFSLHQNLAANEG